MTQVRHIILSLIISEHAAIEKESLDAHHSEQIPILQNPKVKRGSSALSTSSHHHHPSRFESRSSSLDVLNRLLELEKAHTSADQAAKLSAFCNRPAIPHFGYNWLTEFICTITLIVGTSLLKNRLGSMGNEEWILRGFYPLALGFYVFALISCLGGPTGFSSNPCRDLGPRLAHFLLPIQGKGPSEWMFGLVVFTATFAGGFVSGLILLLII
jgi:hypothetical protein